MAEEYTGHKPNTKLTERESHHMLTGILFSGLQDVDKAVTESTALGWRCALMRVLMWGCPAYRVIAERTE